MTVRDALNSALDEEMARDEDVFIVGEEVRDSLALFLRVFPLFRLLLRLMCCLGYSHRLENTREPIR